MSIRQQVALKRAQCVARTNRTPEAVNAATQRLIDARFKFEHAARFAVAFAASGVNA